MNCEFNLSGAETLSPLQHHTSQDVENLNPSISILKTEKPEDEESDEQYPSTKVVIPIILSSCLAVFLSALDRTIVGVAIPAISNEFQSFDDISWYESAYLLTFCVFQLPMGKIYKYFSTKWVYVTSVVIFEVGSIVCAAAPSSDAFIVGRAITGIGGAGCIIGAQLVIRQILPLRKRPQYQGSIGAVFGVSSVVGPILGGIFATDVTWRWCFWISVPIAGFALAGLLFILPASPPPDKISGSFHDKLKKFDPIGNLFLAPGLVCLLLAIQWGGSTYAWNDVRVVVLLTVGVVFLVGFVLIQCWVQENGTVPPRIFCQRSVASCAFASIGIGAALVIAAFYLPIRFQAIEGISAARAGIRLLPYLGATVISIIGSGIGVSKSGYYTPWLIAGCAVLIVGNALLTTLKVGTDTGHLVGYEIIAGAGIGLSLVQSNNAMQTVLSKEDVPIGVTIVGFTQQFGGTIFVSIAQTILSNTLRSQLAKTLPGFDTSLISNTGATDFQDLVTSDQLPLVLAAYNAGIDNLFYCGLGVSCFALFAAFFVEWKSVKSEDGRQQNVEV